jgi:hypothetical protein
MGIAKRGAVGYTAVFYHRGRGVNSFGDQCLRIAGAARTYRRKDLLISQLFILYRRTNLNCIASKV